MAEYISREAAQRAILKAYALHGNEVQYIETMCQLGLVLSADVVERKKGKWEDNTKDGSWKCSECGFISYSIGFYKRYNTKYRMRFCPNCGADMRGRENERTD